MGVSGQQLTTINQCGSRRASFAAKFSWGSGFGMAPRGRRYFPFGTQAKPKQEIRLPFECWTSSGFLAQLAVSASPATNSLICCTEVHLD